MSHEITIYISKAVRLLSYSDIEQIATVSAEKNRTVDITGVLLQIGSFYVQVLEGDPWKVSSLLERIKRDDRHSDMRVIFNEEAQARLFGSWAMGHFNIEKYYHANRLDVVQLQRYTEQAFASNKTSKNGIVQVIKSLPAVCFL